MSGRPESEVILETERLLLRLQRADDIDFLVDLWSDPAITRGLGGPRDRDSLRAGFAATAAEPAAERFDLWPLVERASGRLVGHCGLLDKQVEGRDEVELVYVIAAAYQRRGYATEIGRALAGHGLREFGLDRIIALIEPGNEVSEWTARAIGMRFQREVKRPGGATRRVYAIAGAATPAETAADEATADGRPGGRHG
jgi:RimJ/RimL family protein N-acetyltransferase